MPYDQYGNWIPDEQMMWGYMPTPTPAPAPTPAPTTNWTLPQSWLNPAVQTMAPQTVAPASTGGGGITNVGAGSSAFPAGTEVYGGEGWMQQMAQQVYQMFMANMQQEMATGYVTPSDKPLTQTDAMSAIYQARPDLQQQHQEKYSDWSVSRYMEHWWEGSGEMSEGRHWTDPTTGREWVNTKDVTAVEFAIARGWLQPGPGAEGTFGLAPTDPTAGDWRPPLKGDETEAEIAALYAEHVPEDAPWMQWPEKQKTLEREAFEAGQTQWQDEFLRAQGLDEEAIRQFNEAMQLQRDQYDTTVIEANRQFLRAQGLDEEDMRRWEAGQEQLKEATTEDKRRWNETFAREQGLDEEAIRQFGEQMTLSYYQADQAQSQFETEQLRLIGVSEQQAAQFQQTHQLARDQFDVGNQQWQQAFGLQQAQFDRETGQWQTEHSQRVAEFEATYGLDKQMAETLASQWEQEFQQGGTQWGAEFGLAERQQTEEERYNRLQQELEFMGLMTQQQGPRDWMQYGALQRQVQPGLRPEWEQRLLEGAGFAPFQGGGPMPVATDGVQFGPELEAGWQQNMMDQGMQYIQPQTISPQQWANMLPSEKEQLMGLVETPQEMGGYGGWAQDYLDRMMKSWPTGGNVRGASQFGGW